MADVVIMQVDRGLRLPALLEQLQAFGVTRVVFPAREYHSESCVGFGARNPVYETARLWPRGGDGGFAEQFLENLRSSRHVSDT